MGCNKSKGPKPIQEHTEQCRDANVASISQPEINPPGKEKNKRKLFGKDAREQPKIKDKKIKTRKKKVEQLKNLEEELKTKDEQLEVTNKELKDKNKQLEDKDKELEDKDKQLEVTNKELKDKNKLIELLEARFYRVDMILDPSTAHPRLEVSPDGKCVRDTGSVLKVPNSEKRFDSHMFVLAKDGLVKGKHYWEVEVGQKKSWDLGVASESISRKGRITLAPQKGYWVIGLDGKENYWARTDPWTHLKVSGKPTKIGMFLNFPEKILSFFDVNRRSKLHTYTLSSSGKKLYSFFSMGSVTTETGSFPLKIPPWLEEDTIEDHKEQEEDNIEGHEVSE